MTQTMSVAGAACVVRSSAWWKTSDVAASTAVFPSPLTPGQPGGAVPARQVDLGQYQTVEQIVRAELRRGDPQQQRRVARQPHRPGKMRNPVIRKQTERGISSPRPCQAV